MAIEDHFGVQIPEGEPAKRIFASVSALAEHIARAGTG
jgi:acyl carrier protein